MEQYTGAVEIEQVKVCNDRLEIDLRSYGSCDNRMGRKSMCSTSIYCGLIPVLLLFNTCSEQVTPAGYRVALGHMLPDVGHFNTLQQSEHPVGSCPANELLSAGEACIRLRSNMWMEGQ